MMRMGHEFPGQLEKGAEAESLALRGLAYGRSRVLEPETWKISESGLGEEGDIPGNGAKNSQKGKREAGKDKEIRM